MVDERWVGFLIEKLLYNYQYLVKLLIFCKMTSVMFFWP